LKTPHKESPVGMKRARFSEEQIMHFKEASAVNLGLIPAAGILFPPVQ